MNTPLIPLLEPDRHLQPAPPRFALWALGFRPFYLLAALWALVGIPLWALQLSSGRAAGWTSGLSWHAHEMVFGYTLAVVVGFLFTAGRNWSGQPTPTGPMLMVMAGLWLCARVLAFSPWELAAGLANALFAWAAAWGLWRALHAGNNRRNYFFVALLVGMGLASLGLHLQATGLIRWPQGLGVTAALDIVLFMIAVMGGRVIPMFSNNGVPSMNARRHPWVEPVALASVLILLAADALGLGGSPLAYVAAASATAHLVRWLLWQPWRTWRNPLVWILHAAYAWVPVHLALRAAAAWNLVAIGPATHALTLGAIGGLTLGMITRTALGHTGRPLRAGPWETTAFGAMMLAAAVRVLVPLFEPAWLLPAVHTSAALWCIAFVCYLIRYLPILCRARVDGREG
jgi:uncharacterized protein involved in response to NO